MKPFKVNRRNSITIYALVVLLFFAAILTPLQTFAASNSQIDLQNQLNNTLIEELDHIDFTGFNEIIADFENNEVKLFSFSNIKDKVYSIITGENTVSYPNFIASIFSNVIELIIKYLPLLSLVVAIGVISNLLSGVKSKFNEKSTGNLISTVCFMTVAMLIIAIINNLTTSTGKSILSMVKQMNVVFPILLTMMAGIGATASVGAFQPIVAIMSTYIADIFNYYILPLFMFSFVFAIISHISDNIKLDKFSSFISSLFKWSVGIVFTLFFAVFSIQGISAGSFDSVSIRTTKYS